MERNCRGCGGLTPGIKYSNGHLFNCGNCGEEWIEERDELFQDTTITTFRKGD